MDANVKYDICFVCFEDLRTDARTLNLVKTFVKNGTRVAIIAPETIGSGTIPGADCYFVPPHEPVRFLYKWIRFNRNVKRYKDLQASIYWADDFYSLDAARILHRRNGGRLFYDSREIYSALGPLAGHPIKQMLIAAKEKKLVRYVDLITVSGQMDMDYLRDYFKTRVKFSLIMNLPPKTEIPKNDKLHKLLNIPPQQQIILYQGVVLKGRGIVMTIRALQFLDDCDYVIIGDGPFRAEAEELTRALHLEDRVHFTGKIPYSELPVYTAGADIGTAFIEPVTFSYRLALPNKLFEYFMAGLPVLASDLQALRKVFSVEGDPPGELLDTAAGPREFAQSIRKILENKEKYAAASRKLAERYCYEYQEPEILKLLSE